MGHFYATDEVPAEPQLRTQEDWRKFIEVIRRNTPMMWLRHSEFESTANECLAETLRAFDSGKGVPFEGFLAYVAARRVPEVLRRFARGEDYESTDDEGTSATSGRKKHGYRHDDVAPRQRDGFADVDALDAVHRFARTLPAVERETALHLSRGLKPTEIARSRGVGRSAVSNVMSRIAPKAEVLRAA